VIPESELEQKKIEEIINNASRQKTDKINISELDVIDNSKKARSGFWRQINK